MSQNSSQVGSTGDPQLHVRAVTGTSRSTNAVSSPVTDATAKARPSSDHNAALSEAQYGLLEGIVHPVTGVIDPITLTAVRSSTNGNAVRSSTADVVPRLNIAHGSTSATTQRPLGNNTHPSGSVSSYKQPVEFRNYEIPAGVASQEARRSMAKTRHHNSWSMPIGGLSALKKLPLSPLEQAHLKELQPAEIQILKRKAIEVSLKQRKRIRKNALNHWFTLWLSRKERTLKRRELEVDRLAEQLYWKELCIKNHSNMGTSMNVLGSHSVHEYGLTNSVENLMKRMKGFSSSSGKYGILDDNHAGGKYETSGSKFETTTGRSILEEQIDPHITIKHFDFVNPNSKSLGVGGRIGGGITPRGFGLANFSVTNPNFSTTITARTPRDIARQALSTGSYKPGSMMLSSRFSTSMNGRVDDLKPTPAEFTPRMKVDKERCNSIDRYAKGLSSLSQGPSQQQHQSHTPRDYSGMNFTRSLDLTGVFGGRSGGSMSARGILERLGEQMRGLNIGNGRKELFNTIKSPVEVKSPVQFANSNSMLGGLAAGGLSSGISFGANPGLSESTFIVNESMLQEAEDLAEARAYALQEMDMPDPKLEHFIIDADGLPVITEEKLRQEVRRQGGDYVEESDYLWRKQNKEQMRRDMERRRAKYEEHEAKKVAKRQKAEEEAKRGARDKTPSPQKGTASNSPGRRGSSTSPLHDKDWNRDTKLTPQSGGGYSPWKTARDVVQTEQHKARVHRADTLARHLKKQRTHRRKDHRKEIRTPSETDGAKEDGQDLEDMSQNASQYSSKHSHRGRSGQSRSPKGSPKSHGSSKYGSKSTNKYTNSVIKQAESLHHRAAAEVKRRQAEYEQRRREEEREGKLRMPKKTETFRHVAENRQEIRSDPSVLAATNSKEVTSRQGISKDSIGGFQILDADGKLMPDSYDPSINLQSSPSVRKSIARGNGASNSLSKSSGLQSHLTLNETKESVMTDGSKKSAVWLQSERSPARSERAPTPSGSSPTSGGSKSAGSSLEQSPSKVSRNVPRASEKSPRQSTFDARSPSGDGSVRLGSFSPRTVPGSSAKDDSGNSANDGIYRLERDSELISARSPEMSPTMGNIIDTFLAGGEKNKVSGKIKNGSKSPSAKSAKSNTSTTNRPDSPPPGEMSRLPGMASPRQMLKIQGHKEHHEDVQGKNTRFHVYRHNSTNLRGTYVSLRPVRTPRTASRDPAANLAIAPTLIDVKTKINTRDVNKTNTNRERTKSDLLAAVITAADSKRSPTSRRKSPTDTGVKRSPREQQNSGKRTSRSPDGRNKENVDIPPCLTTGTDKNMVDTIESLAANAYSAINRAQAKTFEQVKRVPAAKMAAVKGDLSSTLKTTKQINENPKNSTRKFSSPKQNTRLSGSRLSNSNQSLNLPSMLGSNIVSSQTTLNANGSESQNSIIYDKSAASLSVRGGMMRNSTFQNTSQNYTVVESVRGSLQRHSMSEYGKKQHPKYFKGTNVGSLEKERLQNSDSNMNTPRTNKSTPRNQDSTGRKSSPFKKIDQPGGVDVTRGSSNDQRRGNTSSDQQPFLYYQETPLTLNSSQRKSKKNLKKGVLDNGGVYPPYGGSLSLIYEELENIYHTNSYKERSNPIEKWESKENSIDVVKSPGLGEKFLDERNSIEEEFLQEIVGTKKSKSTIPGQTEQKIEIPSQIEPSDIEIPMESPVIKVTIEHMDSYDEADDAQQRLRENLGEDNSHYGENNSHQTGLESGSGVETIANLDQLTILADTSILIEKDEGTPMVYSASGSGPNKVKDSEAHMNERNSKAACDILPKKSPVSSKKTSASKSYSQRRSSPDSYVPVDSIIPFDASSGSLIQHVKTPHVSSRNTPDGSGFKSKTPHGNDSKLQGLLLNADNSSKKVTPLVISSRKVTPLVISSKKEIPQLDSQIKYNRTPQSSSHSKPQQHPTTSQAKERSKDDDFTPQHHWISPADEHSALFHDPQISMIGPDGSVINPNIGHSMSLLDPNGSMFGEDPNNVSIKNGMFQQVLEAAEQAEALSEVMLRMSGEDIIVPKGMKEVLVSSYSPSDGASDIVVTREASKETAFVSKQSSKESVFADVVGSPFPDRLDSRNPSKESSSSGSSSGNSGSSSSSSASYMGPPRTKSSPIELDSMPGNDGLNSSLGKTGRSGVSSTGMSASSSSSNAGNINKGYFDESEQIESEQIATKKRSPSQIEQKSPIKQKSPEKKIQQNKKFSPEKRTRNKKSSPDKRRSRSRRESYELDLSQMYVFEGFRSMGDEPMVSGDNMFPGVFHIDEDYYCNEQYSAGKDEFYRSPIKDFFESPLKTPIRRRVSTKTGDRNAESYETGVSGNGVSGRNMNGITRASYETGNSRDNSRIKSDRSDKSEESERTHVEKLFSGYKRLVNTDTKNTEYFEIWTNHEDNSFLTEESHEIPGSAVRGSAGVKDSAERRTCSVEREILFTTSSEERGRRIPGSEEREMTMRLPASAEARIDSLESKASSSESKFKSKSANSASSEAKSGSKRRASDEKSWSGEKQSSGEQDTTVRRGEKTLVKRSDVTRQQKSPIQSRVAVIDPSSTIIDEDRMIATIGGTIETLEEPRQEFFEDVAHEKEYERTNIMEDISLDDSPYIPYSYHHSRNMASSHTNRAQHNEMSNAEMKQKLQQILVKEEAKEAGRYSDESVDLSVDFSRSMHSNESADLSRSYYHSRNANRRNNVSNMRADIESLQDSGMDKSQDSELSNAEVKKKILEVLEFADSPYVFNVVNNK